MGNSLEERLANKSSYELLSLGMEFMLNVEIFCIKLHTLVW
jgi:hypothetical protein